ncbi:MAG: hypothetical protein Q8P84_03125 [Deltaproteobacteria bacterium]|nr:hypothetical protein [Deltaproteobacteria bacterium]
MESKKVTQEENIYLNYEEGVCEAPPPAAENLAVKTPTEHLDFDKNVCTAEPLNYSIQPGKDDQFIFEPQPKAVAKTEEKKSIEKSAERFGEEPQPVRRVALKKAPEEETVFVGAMAYAAAAPSSATAVAPESSHPLSAPASALPFKGAVIFLGIETTSPSENATRARRERGEGQPITEPVLESERALLAIGFARNEAISISEGTGIAIPALSSPLVLVQETAAQYLGIPLAQMTEAGLPSAASASTVREGEKEPVLYNGMPYALLASETIYVSLFVLNSENRETRSHQPVFNDAQSLLVLLSQTSPDEGSFQTPLVVLHPAMLPLETTRTPLFNLGRGAVSSESERVVARAEAQGSKNNNGQQGGNGQNKQDGEPSHEFEFVDDLQPQV